MNKLLFLWCSVSVSRKGEPKYSARIRPFDIEGETERNIMIKDAPWNRVAKKDLLKLAPRNNDGSHIGFEIWCRPEDEATAAHLLRDAMQKTIDDNLKDAQTLKEIWETRKPKGPVVATNAPGE